MKFLKILLFTFITLTAPVKADLNKNLDEGGKLIFIRHAYAPGSGDPQNFNLNDCSTQRNLSVRGKNQAKKIGLLFAKSNLLKQNIFSSEWCRCKETAKIAFKNFKTKTFLNSFFSSKFVNNREKQLKDFEIFIKNWNKKDNLIFVTHYVFISEVFNYAPSSGEIVISDKNLKIIDTIQVKY